MKKQNKKIRRSYGDGSLYFDKNGYWYYAKRLIINGIRKRVKTCAKSKTEAIRKFYNKYGDDNSLNFENKNNLEINELFLHWLMNVKRLSVTSSTLNSNLMIFRLYIKPYFENKTIGTINNNTILLFFNHLLHTQAPKSMFIKSKFLLNQFSNFLVLNNYLDCYPLMLNSIKYPKSKDEIKYKAIPKEIRRDYIEKLNNHPTLKIICYLGLFAGMRIGEILSLRWSALDLEKRTININTSIFKDYKFDKRGKLIISTRNIGTTKTSCSLRVVPIVDKLYDAIIDWKLTQTFISGKNPLLFAYENNLRSYSGTRRLLDRFNKKYGFEKYNIHFHTFRHTFATVLFEQKVNPKIIQCLLGHKSVKTTLEIYNNVNLQGEDLLNFINDKFSNID